jgi:class 3 adenylate cyclase
VTVTVTVTVTLTAAAADAGHADGDVRRPGGSTAIVERMHPDALAEVLNRWLYEVSTIGFRHGGTFDDFMGDAVIASFGAPEPTGERDQAAGTRVRMALEVQARGSARGRAGARRRRADARRDLRARGRRPTRRAFRGSEAEGLRAAGCARPPSPRPRRRRRSATTSPACASR